MVVKSDNKMWELADKSSFDKEQISRPSLTYWQDAWRRLKKNMLAMLGLCIVILVTLVALVGPYFSNYSYSDQDLDHANIPPSFNIYKIEDGKYVYMNREYTLINVTEDGVLGEAIKVKTKDVMKRSNIFDVDGKEVVVDYSFAIKAKKSGDPNAKKFEIRVDEKAIPMYSKVHNKSYKLGTDDLGRDILVRLMYGARVSLIIALIATCVNFFIGVIYGGISGYLGGKADSVMMRIVDIISTVPLLIYVILLMVVMGPGIKTICVALGTVYWVRMARLVRGQILSIKEQEFVLAARTLGASMPRILLKHLIPNAMGPIIVTLAMTIPQAIFTEAFLSFIGLGVSVPKASWGSLAQGALGGLRSYPYQLLWPSICISITVLSFNFLGDGLRDALDPRLRK